MSARDARRACEPEWFTAAYAEGALAAGDARRVELHLVHCERCRRAVLALREEAHELGRALRASAASARDIPAHPHAEPTPARTDAPAGARLPQPAALALGLPLSIALLAIVGALVGEAAGARLPSFLAWLHPARILEGNTMFWNLLFWLRDESRALFELAASFGAVAGFAALGSFVLNAFGRRLAATATRRRFPNAAALLAGGALLGAAFAVVPAAPAHAAPLLSKGEIIHIAKGESVDSTLIANGDEVRIEGRVQGDAVVLAERARISGVIEGNLVIAGRDIEVTGEVQGNLIVAAKDVEFAGTVGGSVLLAASEAEIAGAVAGSLFAAGEDLRTEVSVALSAHFAARNLYMDEATRLARDATVLAQNANIAGRVGRDLATISEKLALSGQVARDAALRGEHLQLTESARVGRNVAAFAPPGGFTRAEGAQVGGEVTHTKIEDDEPRAGGRFPFRGDRNFYLLGVVWLAGEFFVGLLLYWLLPGIFRARAEGGGDVLLSVVLGAASLPVVALGSLLLAVTLIGIPLAVLALLAYGCAGYIAFLVVAAMLGRLIMRSGESETLRDFGVALLVGLLLLALLVNIPFIGGAAWWVVLSFGLGLLIRRARESWELRRALSAGASVGAGDGAGAGVGGAT